MSEKTPEQEATKQVNKSLGKAIAKREMEIKRHEANTKKLRKEIDKIKNGELVPEDSEDSSDSSYTLINFILDETGSMHSVKEKTINAFNEYVQSLRKEKGKVTLTLTKFNSTKTEISYANKNVSRVSMLTEETYNPDSLTNLYDAIGKTIRKIEKGLKDSKNVKVLTVILTDGNENASQEYTQDGIKKLIKEKETKGWEFVYLGASEEAWDKNQSLGIASGNSMNFSRGNIRSGMQAMSFASASFHQGKTTKGKIFGADGKAKSFKRGTK